MKKLKLKSKEMSSLSLNDQRPIKDLILMLSDPDLSLSKKEPAFIKFKEAISKQVHDEIQSLSTEYKDGFQNLKAFVNNENGRFAVPILLYVLGVPGFLVIVLWLLFFRG